MKPRTPAERKAAERARKHTLGLKELRGLWVTPAQEKKLKALYKQLMV